MPVLVDIDAYDHHLFSRAPSGSAAAKASPGNRVECLDIGLINNMPDSALMSTERQLFDLLGAAAGRLVVRLHFYTMETTPRSEWGRDYVRRYYRGTDDLVQREPGRNNRDRRRTESCPPDGRAILDRASPKSWTGPGRIRSRRCIPVSPSMGPSCTWTAWSATSCLPNASVSSLKRRREIIP